MKRTYRIKATKTAILTIEVENDDLSQQEVYDIAKDRVQNSRNVKWNDPSFNIIQIVNDPAKKGPKTPQTKYS